MNDNVDDNVDETKLTYEQLQEQYEMSQWALAHALLKLGGCMMVTHADVAEAPGPQLVWYHKGVLGTFVELRDIHYELAS